MKPIVLTHEEAKRLTRGELVELVRRVKPSKRRPWFTEGTLRSTQRWEPCRDNSTFDGWWQLAIGEPGPRIGGLDPGYIGVTPCPLGKPGDILWVREGWAVPGAVARSDDPIDPERDAGRVVYRADGTGAQSWRSPVTMPRWASRWTLKVKRVSVERRGDDRAWHWVAKIEKVER
jgi:hypothetical protein